MVMLLPGSIAPSVGKKIAVKQGNAVKSIDISPATQTACRGVLLPYQLRWIEDRSRVKVCAKSRRIGLSWADAYESVATAAASQGSDVYYIGYNREMAEQYISDCAEWAAKLNLELADRGTSIIKDADKDVLIFRIRFASGHKISALSSKPTNLRAKKGRFVLDEFAFHQNPDELLKAGLAALMWGGRVAIISTFNGIDNEFNRVVERCRSGELDYSLHQINLDDALEEGLYKRICEVQGLQWSLTAEQAWRTQLFKDYGRSANEELLCIPSSGNGGIIDPAWFQRYTTPPAQPEQIIISVDSAAKAQQINDPWCFTVWSIWQGKFYLVDCLIRRMDYPTGKRMLLSYIQKHGARTVLIEDKSTGQSLIPELKTDLSIRGTAIIPIVPVTDKITRLSVETPAFEGGLVHLPHTAPWLPEYESALLSFPEGIADPADSTSQFLAWARQHLRRRSPPIAAGKLSRL